MDLFRKQCTRIGKRFENWILKVSANSQNPFWLLDMFLILAGVHFMPRNRWQRVAWTVYTICLPVSYLFIALVGLFSALIFKEDSSTLITASITVVTMAECLAKHGLLLRYSDGIRTLRNYLESPTFGSGDSEYDENVRKRFRRKARVLMVGISLIVFAEQILSWFPNDQQFNAFYIHPWVGTIWGKNTALAIRIWYIFVFVVIWLFKMYGCTVTSVVLMLGLEAEQKVLTHNFERIQECLQDLRQSYWDSELARKQYWDRMRISLRLSVNQQLLLLSHLGELKPLVENLFFWIYYANLGLTGSAMFLVFTEQLTFIHFAIIGTVFVCAFEVYSVSFLVESLKDAFDSIAGPALYWCARLPFSEDHHGTYVEMRTSLQIIAACFRNVVSFGCAGISDISVAAFANMLNICYSVFTFLRDTT